MRMLLLALGAGTLFVVTAATTADSVREPATALSAADDFSASNRRYVRYRYHEAPAYYPYRWRRGAADPSIGPDGRPYQRPAHLGGCVIDEGYGRFSACPSR